MIQFRAPDSAHPGSRGRYAGAAWFVYKQMAASRMMFLNMTTPMELLDLLQTPVSFYDVVDSFSEEEWKLLQLWQKELYNNLMKELQQAFNTLGPLIATSVFSLKPKVKEDTCSVKLQDLDTMDKVNLYLGNTASESDMMFGENRYLKGSPDAGIHGNLDVSNAGTADMAVAVSFSIKREEEMYSDFKSESINCTTRNTAPESDMIIGENQYLKAFPDAGEHGSLDVPNTGTADMAVAVSFRIKSEEEMYSNFEKSESISCTTQLDVTAPVTSIGIKEVGEIYPIGMQDNLRGESSYSHIGKGNMNRKRNIGNAFRYNDAPRLCKIPSKKLKANVVRKVNQKNIVTPVWSGNDGERQNDIKTQSLSGFHQQDEFSSQKTIFHVQPSEIYDNRESTVIADYNLPCKKSTLQNPQSDQSYQKDCSTGHQQAPQLKVRYPRIRYPCSECGKTLLGMPRLIRHQRIHTGERPFLCTVCGKRFMQKGDLQRHQQVHTGARPYKCNLCQKTFTQKWLLHAHEKMHINTKIL